MLAEDVVLNKRCRVSRQWFDPTPIPDAHIRAAMRLNPSCSPAEIPAELAEMVAHQARTERQIKTMAAAEEAARLRREEAATPRPLPFSLPPRVRVTEHMELVTDTLELPAAHSSRMKAVASDKLRCALQQQPRRVAALWREIEIARNAGALTELVAEACAHLADTERMHFRPTESGRVIDVCSEFTGIGGLEHGLHAGFREATVDMQLKEASELSTTSAGRHATAVLRKRFPKCIVLDPASRACTEYPASVTMLNVTPSCTQHSGLNANGCPEETEAMLFPVFERIKAATQLEVIVLEEVPNFLTRLEGQTRSSYALWVNGLEKAGFCEHAYVVMPTWAAGDLHHRSRLLSLHTKGCFHPASALMRLLSDEPQEEEPVPVECDGVFCFSTGLSETRHAARGGISPVWGRLPAYNSVLNVAIHFKGVFYSLSPWLAARCSGLPDQYQHVGSKCRHLPEGADTRPSMTDAAVALANMVSPLQARELGYAIASEWQDPRAISEIPSLLGAPEASSGSAGKTPKLFPRSRSSTLAQPATLCFNHPMTGSWHGADQHYWKSSPPSASLRELCEEALRRGELPLLRSLVDLQRVVDDSSLNEQHRDSAARQLARVQKEADERQRLRAELLRNMEEERRARELRNLEVKKRRAAQYGTWCQTVSLAELRVDSPDLLEHLHSPMSAQQQRWIACDLCGQWRRWQQRRPIPEASWSCTDNPDRDFANCSVAQELPDDEIDRQLLLGEVDDDRCFDTVTIALRGSSLPSTHPPCSWAACDRCGKWRRLLLPLDRWQQHTWWYCEFNSDRKRNRCEAAEETWTEEVTLADQEQAVAYETPALTATRPFKSAPETAIHEHACLAATHTFDDASVAADIAACLFDSDSAQRSTSPHELRNDQLPPPTHPKGEEVAIGSMTRNLTPLVFTSSPCLVRSILPAHDSDKQVHSAVIEQNSIVAVKVLNHHVYRGATAGSLKNVYARLAFSDGRTTGPYYVPIVRLLFSTVLADYLQTANGVKMRPYLPATEVPAPAKVPAEAPTEPEAQATATEAMEAVVATAAAAAERVIASTRTAEDTVTTKGGADSIAELGVQPVVTVAARPRATKRQVGDDLEPCMACSRMILVGEEPEVYQGAWRCRDRGVCGERKRKRDTDMAGDTTSVAARRGERRRQCPK